MKTVLVFGTFDIIHKGHLKFFEQAKSAGGNDSKLVVVVARDVNVEREKGKKPVNDESTRLENIKRLHDVDGAVLGRENDRLSIIEEIKPDLICLGYDQQVPEGFMEKTKKLGIKAARLKPYREKEFKSSKIKNN